MTSAPTHLKIALAQANPIVGDIDGNIAKLRECARAPAAPAPTSSSSRSCSSPAIRPRISCASRRFRRRAARASRRWRRETGDGGPAVLVGTVWPEDGKLYNAVVLLDGGKVEAVRFKVDLPNYGVFDEKRVFDAGPDAGADQLPRRAPRRADLRGHLGRRRRRVPAGDRRGDPHLAQRLAVRLAEARRAHERRRRARHRDAACRSSTSTRSAARTSWCSTAPRSCSTPTRASPCSCRPGRRAVASPQWHTHATAAGVCEPARARAIEEGDAAAYQPACWACATTSRRTAFPASCSACRAASTARSSPPSPSTRSGPSACTA